MNIPIVREAHPDDSRRIAEIHVAAWRAAYSDIMDAGFLSNLSVLDREKMWSTILSTGDRGNYLVCLENSVVQGFCAFGRARDEDLNETYGELVVLNVDPCCWRNGIGSNLLEQALHCLSKADYQNVCLWVAQKNQRAISFYEHFGFLLTDLQKIDTTQSDHPVTEIRFEKTPV